MCGSHWNRSGSGSPVTLTSQIYDYQILPRDLLCSRLGICLRRAPTAGKISQLPIGIEFDEDGVSVPETASVHAGELAVWYELAK